MHTSDPADEIEARHVNTDITTEITAAEFDHHEWERAKPVLIERYWSGETAPAGRRAEVRVIWTEEALAVRFVCRQSEPLVVSELPAPDQKTIGLWERDVCEIFIAPDADAPERYFEFEAAPTGEWLDLRIHTTPTERESDWHYKSGMSVAARVTENQVTIVMRVPWNALVKRPPRAGERWRANLFRCVGTGASRGYLAWRPTETPQPNFHVPAAFGWLRFEEGGKGEKGKGKRER
ncbi:MAG: carbohydrate-binding family 9-like protein [Acidobacteriota bacterium]|nr:carbohydrate-binding family 9-like protein [Acidobacteriota bacterium]